MSRSSLAVTPAPPPRRWFARSEPAVLRPDAVREALTPLVGPAAAVGLTAGPGPGGMTEVDLVGAIVHVSLSVHWEDGRMCAVSATLHGFSDDEQADRAEVEPVVCALLELAESTGSVLETNVGTVNRSNLADVLLAL